MRLRINCIFIIFLWLFFVSACHGNDKPEIAPNFVIIDIDGNEIDLSALKGKRVVLDFWATWCPPCRQSIPEMVKLQKKYEDELEIIGISLDDPLKLDDSSLRKFMKKNKMNYRVARLTQEIMQSYFKEGEKILIPTLFIIDSKGNLREKLVGFEPGRLEAIMRNIKN